MSGSKPSAGLTKMFRKAGGVKTGRKAKPKPKVKAPGTTTCPTVYIDSRTGSKELVEHYPFNLCGELTTLEHGDVMIVGHGPDDSTISIGVEYKSLFDLISSIDTGRLQATQLPGLLENYDVPCLLYYGLYRPSFDGKLEIYRGNGWQPYSIGKREVHYAYIEKIVFEMAMMGVRVKHVGTKEAAVQWLQCIAEWADTPWHKHKGMHTFDTSRDSSLLPGLNPDVEQRARVAAQLPGVGFKRAVTVAKHFKSVREMVNAGRDEWATIPGIGKVVARTVEEAVK